MRAFIAIALPEQLGEGIADLQTELKKEDLFIGRFVEPKNLHINLKFLGEIPESLVEGIEQAAKEICTQKKFNVQLKGFGAFPSQHYIRVLWIGIGVGNEQLLQLQKALDAQLVKLRFKPDRRFSAHITLARVRAVREKAKLQSLFKKWAVRDFGGFEVKDFKLMKSTLTREGPIYEEIASFKLKD